MPLARRKPQDAATRPEQANEASSYTEFAWRIHAAQEGWANKTDIKASILLALEGGALFAVIAANAKGGLLATLKGWQHITETAGVCLLIMALVCAAISVFPRLGRVKSLQASFSDDFIYFGHLRFWEPWALEEKLKILTADQSLGTLSRQLIEIAKSNWGKLRWIQISLGIAILAVLVIAIAAISTF